MKYIYNIHTFLNESLARFKKNELIHSYVLSMVRDKKDDKTILWLNTQLRNFIFEALKNERDPLLRNSFRSLKEYFKYGKAENGSHEDIIEQYISDRVIENPRMLNSNDYF